MTGLKGIGLAAAFGLCAAAAQAQAAGDWAHFGGTLGDTKYSALDQINAGTINRLKVAWRAPALDPARISVNSQMAHLKAGKVSAEKFDYDYLRFQGQRFGTAALKELAATSSGKDATVIVMKAKAALEKDALWNAKPQKIDRKLLALNLSVRTPGQVLPESFLAQNWQETIKENAWKYPDCLHDSGKSCDVFLVDLTADGVSEVLIRQEVGPLFVFRLGKGGWVHEGNIAVPHDCGPINDALRLGRIAAAPAQMADAVIAGRHYRMVKDAPATCPPATAGKP
jgi:hypothetical protein